MDQAQEQNAQQNISQPTSQVQAMGITGSNIKKGILWLTLPVPVLMLLLSIYAFTAYMSALSGGAGLSGVLRSLIGILGAVNVFLVFVGIVYGVMLLIKRDRPLQAVDPRSGKEELSEVPDEIKKWNWGAAGLGILWGLANRSWLSLLVFIPFVGLFWWIVMGIQGNDWAWRNNYWESVDEFTKFQNRWKVWGIISFVLMVLFMLMPFIAGSFLSLLLPSMIMM